MIFKLGFSISRIESQAPARKFQMIFLKASLHYLIFWCVSYILLWIDFFLEMHLVSVDFYEAFEKNTHDT